MFASTLGSEYQGAIHAVPESEEIVAVCLQGEFDAANVSTLRDHVDGTLASGKNLILDLSLATFIDSSVIRALFDAGRAVNGKDQLVVLQLGTAPVVERALEIAEIERVLPRAHHREEAVRVIQQQAGNHVAEVTPHAHR